MTVIKKESLMEKVVCDGFVMAVCDALWARGGAGFKVLHH